MERTIKTKIGKSKDLENTIKQYNQIANLHIAKSLELKSNSKKKLHNACYNQVKHNFPKFPSALIQCARDNAIEMLRGNEYKKRTKKKDYSNIRYDKRTLRVDWNGKVSISTINGRKKLDIKIPEYFKQKYGKGEIKSATLGYQDNKLFIFLCVEVQKPEKKKVKNTLGIDLGINNIYSTSEGEVVKSKELNRNRRKHAYLRKQLQSKGTRSAKRKLRKLSGREERFTKDWIHKATKEIANKDYELFALENLKNLRKGKKGRVFNRKRSQFPFFRFRNVLKYKLEQLGKNFVLVDPKYTSQRCSQCSFVAKTNRNKGWFVCKRCGYQDNSDVNASKNISQIGFNLFEQDAVNHSNVSKLSIGSFQN